MKDPKGNLNTANQVKCPTCGSVQSTRTDADKQVMCAACGENIGHTFGKAWEQAFDTFYDGSIPPRFQVGA